MDDDRSEPAGPLDVPTAHRAVRRASTRGGVSPPGNERRLHRTVWFVVALHLSFGLLFSLLVPAFRAPDEANHLDMLRRYRVQLGHDAPDRHFPQGLDVATADSSVATSQPQPRPPLRAEDAPPRGDRATFADLAPPGTPSGVQNNMSQHPPLYYAAVAGATTAIAGLLPVDVWSWDRELYLFRLVSILLTAPIPVLAAVAARAVGLSRVAGGGAAAATLLVPQATLIGAAVNNDALVMLGAAAATALALDHLRTGRPATAWLAMSAAVVASLTKSTAAILPVWVLVVVAIAWQRRRATRNDEQARVRTDDATPPGWKSLVGSAAIAGIGASWYVSNLLRFGRPQPSGFPRGATADFTPTLGAFVPGWLDRLTRSFWGMPARRAGVGLPWPVTHLLSGSAVLFAAAALLDRRRRRAAILLLLLIVVQLLLMAQTNWRAHVRLDGLPGVQGRYLFTLLVPLAVVAVVGARQIWQLLAPLVGRLAASSCALGASGAVWAVVLIGSALHWLLAWSMLDGFWGEPGSGVVDAMAAVTAWSPLPAAVTTLIASAAVGLSMVGPVRLITLGARRDPQRRRVPTARS